MQKKGSKQENQSPELGEVTDVKGSVEIYTMSKI